MSRLGKILLGSTAAVALTSGALTLSATQASAQINIEGLIRGAMSQYGVHYYRGRRRGRTHEVRRGRHAKEHEAKGDDSGDSGKDEHPADNGDQANNKPDRQQFSSHPKDTPQTDASAANPPPPPPQQPQPPQQQQPQSTGDVPSFTPEK